MSSSFSKIIAGVMNWGVWGAKLTESEMAKLIEGCLDLGVTSFDHADIYGDNTTEAEWGYAFAKTKIERKDIQIITKCGIMMPSPQRKNIKAKHYDTSKAHIISSVDRSLQNLQTDYIDLLLIHRPSPLMNPHEIKEAIETLRQGGKVRHFGVSNFTSSQTQLMQSAMEVECNQVEISPLELSPFLDGTLDQCMANGIMPMAWSPMGGGRLFESSSNPKLLKQRERLNNVAKKYDWGLDEMIYLFLLHHPADIRPVVGSSKIDRIRTSVKATQSTLSDAQWFEIWTAATGSEVP